MVVTEITTAEVPQANAPVVLPSSETAATLPKTDSNGVLEFNSLGMLLLGLGFFIKKKEF